MQSERKPNRAKLLLFIALILIVVGGLLANLTQTNWGKVDVRDIRFVGTNGVVMSGLLYVPDGVTNKAPAPGILAIHGYFNSREQQGSFAIELSRRGYVVLALDQTGHGYSDPAVATNAFGGPDGLKYLSSLDIVDKNNIGMEGHSMGGWAILNAAKVYPDGYKSMVLEGSGTGGIGNLVYGVPAGTTTWPRNLCVVLSKWDEFSAVMWGSYNPKAPDTGNMNIPSNIGNANAMKAQFGTTDPVVVGQLYGSIANGTVRVLYQPAVIHPADMENTAAVGDAVDWFQKTLTGGQQIPASSQVWYWKEIGTLIAMIGMILLLFPVGSLLLSGVGFFRELQMAPAAPKSAKGIGWWIAALIFAALPAVTYFHFTSYTTTWKFNPSSLFAQPMTNQLMLWVLLLGAASLVLFLLWHYAFNRKAQASAADYGLSWGTGFMGMGWMKILKSFLLALTVVVIAYATLVFSVWLFGTDFRFWVLTFKPMNALQFRVFLSYLLPFGAFFFILSLALHGELRPGKEGKEISMGKEMLINFAMMVIGFLVLLAWQYIPLITGGQLMWPGQQLVTCLIYQLLPVFTIISLVLTYFYRKTGHIYAGVFLIALLITWSLTAGQAIGYNIMP
jgi:pimeloyl-ACP methyl ester carboxylesterase